MKNIKPHTLFISKHSARTCAARASSLSGLGHKGVFLESRKSFSALKMGSKGACIPLQSVPLSVLGEALLLDREETEAMGVVLRANPWVKNLEELKEATFKHMNTQLLALPLEHFRRLHTDLRNLMFTDLYDLFSASKVDYSKLFTFGNMAAINTTRWASDTEIQVCIFVHLLQALAEVSQGEPVHVLVLSEDLKFSGMSYSSQEVLAQEIQKASLKGVIVEIFAKESVCRSEPLYVNFRVEHLMVGGVDTEDYPNNQARIGHKILSWVILLLPLGFLGSLLV